MKIYLIFQYVNMAKKTKRISVKEREKIWAKMRKDPQFKKIYKKCQKNCEKESQVFAIAYKQYLALLFKTKKCDDKGKKVSKAVEDKREHKCLLKFEKETLEPATHKFLKCYKDKVDTCMYKAFEKKSKKTLKRTLKKKTKKTLRKKGGFFGMFKKKEKVDNKQREKVINDVLNVLYGKKSIAGEEFYVAKKSENVLTDDDPFSGKSPKELERSRRHITTTNAANVEFEAQLAALESNKEHLRSEDILRNTIEKILDENYHNEQFKNKKLYTSVILPDIINKVIFYKSELEAPSTSNANHL